MSSDQSSQESLGTAPQEEHKLLEKFLGEWVTSADMSMPDGSPAQAKGKEVCTSLGGLWAIMHGKSSMPDGGEIEYQCGVGYDVSFKGYRGFWVMNMSSHLWKYEGILNEDQTVLTLNCVGPHMVEDGKTANYRDVHTFIDPNNRKMESFYENDRGEWIHFSTTLFKRS